MTDYAGISSRAMLVGLHISTWAARKFDKKATLKVNTDHHAQADASRVNKHLLAGATSHKAVIEAAQAARELHYRETLPWADEGQRLLPTANYMRYTELMRAAHNRFESAVEAFLDTYPTLRDEAQTKLGSLYNEADFPLARDVASKFAWDVAFTPIPTKGDLRLDLPSDEVAHIEQLVAERMEASAKQAMQAAWARLEDAVLRIEKAAGDNGIVRSSLIENAQLVCETLKRLNVAQDASLEAMRELVERELTGIAVEDLRSDSKLRDDTARRAADILAAMGSLYAPAAA